MTTAAWLVVGLGVPLLVLVVRSDRAARKSLEILERLDTVKQEVSTGAERKIGRLASEDEERRIEAIPFPERTPTEQQHLEDAPESEPPQGPSPGGR